MTEQIVFSDRDEFRQWLHSNHRTSRGIWLVFGKTDGFKTLRADEALEEALCFGWIDGQIKSLDEDKYLKKFTPRTEDSRWSATNRAIANRLIDSGRMTHHGIAAIERAKNRGTWETPGRQAVTDEQVQVLVDALQGADLALANFLKMPRSVKRTYTAFYLDAKREETKTRRLENIVERLKANKGPM